MRPAASTICSAGVARTVLLQEVLPSLRNSSISAKSKDGSLTRKILGGISDSMFLDMGKYTPFELVFRRRQSGWHFLLGRFDLDLPIMGLIFDFGDVFFGPKLC